MSIEAAQAFMHTARKTKALQQRLDALRGRDALNQLVAIAREAGFEFSVAEYREAVVLESGGELEDQALLDLLETLAEEQRQAYDYPEEP